MAKARRQITVPNPFHAKCKELAKRYDTSIYDVADSVFSVADADLLDRILTLRKRGKRR